MKTFKEQKWMLIVYAVVFIIVGLIEFILSIVDMPTAVKVVSYSIAGGLFIIGLMHLLTCFVAYTKEYFKAGLVLGSIAIAAGVVLCLDPWLVAEFLIPFVAVLALALGAVLIAKAVVGIVYKYEGIWIFSYFAGAAVSITAGVLALVYKGHAQQVIYASTGVLVLTLGVLLLVYGIKLLNKQIA